MERGLFHPLRALRDLIIGCFGDQAKPQATARLVEGKSSAVTSGTVTVFEAWRSPQACLGVVLTT